MAIQDNINDVDNYGIKNLVVFGICANGDYICFDYRENPNSSEPKIVLVYHDDFVDYDDGTSTMVVNHVAENFDDFMNMLHE
ncbi:SMI1/KNR4 family protein [Acinetobacter schindleri]|uniref:SMI1/KNR4 family protein n=1 Tax=Acinetobacter schindleri TaxID=108981 RepID=UPI004045AFDA